MMENYQVLVLRGERGSNAPDLLGIFDQSDRAWPRVDGGRPPNEVRTYPGITGNFHL
jgi:hypothetical protein